MSSARSSALDGTPLGWLSRELAELSGPALGYAFIFLVCVIWVGGSFLVTSLEEQGLSPFLLTYVCNALFVVLLPVYFGRQHYMYGGVRWEELWGGVPTSGAHPGPGPATFRRLRDVDDDDDFESAAATDDDRARRRAHSAADLHLETLNSAPHSAPHSARRADDPDDAELDAPEGRQRAVDTVRAAARIAPVWFLAQLAFNYSLAYTSVTSNSILSTSSSVFTFALSVWLVNERYSRERLAAVFAYVLGSALVTLADAGDGSDTGTRTAADARFGDFLTVVAAALYAGYTAGIRYHLPDDPKVSMLLFLGAVGAWNLVGVGACAVFARALGFLPDLYANLNWTVFGLAVGKGLLDNVLSDYLWARAVLLTSPTVASVGLSMQIPMAAAAEAMMGRARWMDTATAAGTMLVGCGLVMAGFFGVVYK